MNKHLPHPVLRGYCREPWLLADVRRLGVTSADSFKFAFGRPFLKCSSHSDLRSAGCRRQPPRLRRTYDERRSSLPPTVLLLPPYSLFNPPRHASRLKTLLSGAIDPAGTHHRMADPIPSRTMAVGILLPRVRHWSQFLMPTTYDIRLSGHQLDWIISDSDFELSRFMTLEHSGGAGTSLAKTFFHSPSHRSARCIAMSR